MSIMNLIDFLNNGLHQAYNAPNSSQFDYEWKQFVRNLPFVGSAFQAEDNTRQLQDYLKNRGLDWSDIRYNGTPFGVTMGGAAAQATTSAMNLYRSQSRSMARDRERSETRSWRNETRRHRHNWYMAQDRIDYWSRKKYGYR